LGTQGKGTGLERFVGISFMTWSGSNQEDALASQLAEISVWLLLLRSLRTAWCHRYPFPVFHLLRPSAVNSASPRWWNIIQAL